MRVFSRLNIVVSNSSQYDLLPKPFQYKKPEKKEGIPRTSKKEQLKFKKSDMLVDEHEETLKDIKKYSGNRTDKEEDRVQSIREAMKNLRSEIDHAKSELFFSKEKGPSKVDYPGREKDEEKQKIREQNFEDKIKKYEEKVKKLKDHLFNTYGLIK